ncbi:nitroreductase family deazaflavin-dependent oxidoreductase [Amycolatopsis saalfeldensis]|uniref:Uncharacterized protein n=1 Tax=Amycolatopsis saalfeldensis TaxID=394193 RepID=A0A1H8TER9_9PSEU|nr:nitroreductase family deazaflavin-dependent oxidoreductase [Amycolatopsis saalfeldensis]SEO88973.1 hypothetical protein SAMN04489732_102558 [Amycolatopsis saalfeldensis]
MSTPDPTGWSDPARDASSSRLPDPIRRAIDITTLGRTGGAANLLADPTFTFHLENGIRADLPARATPVTDSAERAAVLAEIVADLDQPHDPGTIRPTRLEDWADSRLMRISSPHRP